MILSYEHVGVRYGPRVVLDDCSLEGAEGETLVIIGPSGSGKSTLLRLLVGLQSPDSGRVRVRDRVVDARDRKALREIRADMGYLFQSGALINWMSAGDNVALPLVETQGWSRKKAKVKAQEALELVGLQDAAELMPDELSGGMRKRVGLARCLVTDPRIILYDEPTTGLDPVMSRAIEGVIRDLRDRLSVTSVVVSHDMQGVFQIADRIAMLHEGRILTVGTADEIRSSRDPVVRRFVGGEAESRAGRSEEEEGSPS